MLACSSLLKNSTVCEVLFSSSVPLLVENPPTFAVWNSNKLGLCLWVCLVFFCFSLRLTVCKMTVSLSSAESHLGLNFPVVLHGLLPPWSVSGVGVQLFHQHDKWFRKLPHCSLTNRKHTRMLSTSIFHPVVCICLHLWFRPRGHGMHEGGGGQNWKRLGTGVERKSDFGLDCLSVCRD